jgi:solute carrier family 25 aspartate/glutamate transporter 12/13
VRYSGIGHKSVIINSSFVQKWTWLSGAFMLSYKVLYRMLNHVTRVIRDACAKSKDGRIDQTDFLNHASMTTRYGIFSPMEASIIFHFASRGAGGHSRLALVDFAQLLDPRWKAPSDLSRERAAVQTQRGFLDGMLHSIYNFGLGGIAGSFGATVVYPIDLGWLTCYLLLMQANFFFQSR